MALAGVRAFHARTPFALNIELLLRTRKCFGTGIGSGSGSGSSGESGGFGG